MYIGRKAVENELPMTIVQDAEDSGYRLQVPLTKIFFSFFRVGLTAFGGPAMIPHIRRLALEQHAWVDEKGFRLGMSICQMIPGATVMQLSAYVGYRVRGLTGALAAFIGFGLPAFVLITLLSFFYFKYQDVGWILAAFAGLKVVVIAIVTHATIEFAKKYTKSIPDVLVGIGAACAILLQFHPALIIAAAMLLGLAAYKDLPLPDGPPPACAVQNKTSSFARLLMGLILVLIALALLSPGLLGLMLRMMRVDIFAFGGGFAALPMMLHEVVHNAGWLSEKTFLDGIALGQVTPGPIVITAAFVGYAVKGLMGAIVAAIGIFSPSILMLLWAVPHCDRLLGSHLFRRAMHASLATLGGLMAATVFMLARPVNWSTAGVSLCVCAFAALRWRVDVLWVVLGGTAISLLLL